jgi:anti-anti-sigma regulatory factor
MTTNHALPGDVTIYGVGALLTQFQEWMADLPNGQHDAVLNDEPLFVDASAVSEVDAAGVQLLLSLSKSLAAHRRTLRLASPSSLLASACDTLGVSAALIAADAGGVAA